MKIKMIILDIDGILTDGKKYYGLDGMPFAKTFCDKDFTAIKRMRGAGVKVCFLSGDNRVNEAMAKNRNIDFYYARGRDKATFVEEFEERYGIDREYMAYVGDDLFDINIMKKVGFSCCPGDAPEKVKEAATQTLEGCSGGQNFVMKFVDAILRQDLVPDCTLEDIERLDRNEKF
tara:strand:- start:908 stop:1432 length:525 start_codon:yes stop_codon:yes gene_type:complete